MFSLLLSGEVIAACVSSFIASALSVWLFFAGKHSELTRLRYERLISPLFELSEPYMLRYDRAASLDADSIRRILQDNVHLCGGNLRRFLYDDLSTHKSRIAFCIAVSKEYDSSCRALGLPRRPFLYHFNLYRFRFCFAHVLAFMFASLFVFLLLFTSLVFGFYILLMQENGFVVASLVVFLISSFVLSAYNKAD